jgi:spermidine synthase
LNSRSLLSPKLKIVNSDAFPWLEQSKESFDFAAVDFPDPNNYSLGKLYTTAFYRILKRHLSERGVVVVQSTSPMFARESFWIIAETMKEAGLRVYPYHVYVPSFGEWGFILGSMQPWEMPRQLPSSLRFLDSRQMAGLFQFPPDMAPVPAQPNRLNDQVLVRTYDREWREIAR